MLRILASIVLMSEGVRDRVRLRYESDHCVEVWATDRPRRIVPIGYILFSASGYSWLASYWTDEGSRGASNRFADFCRKRGIPMTSTMEQFGSDR